MYFVYSICNFYIYSLLFGLNTFSFHKPPFHSIRQLPFLNSSTNKLNIVSIIIIISISISISISIIIIIIIMQPDG